MGLFEGYHRGDVELTSTVTKMKKELTHIHNSKGEKEVFTRSVTPSFLRKENVVQFFLVSPRQ